MENVNALIDNFVHFNYGFISEENNRVILFNTSERSFNKSQFKFCRNIDVKIQNGLLIIVADIDQWFYTDTFIPLDKLDFTPDFHDIKTQTKFFSKEKVKGVKYYYRKPCAENVNIIMNNFKIEIYD